MNSKHLLAALAATLTVNTAQAQIAASQAEQILAKPLQITEFSWSAGDPAAIGPPVSTHFCVLTRFSGKLAGEGEFINLYIDQAAAGGPRYMLGGRSGQAQLRLTAGCAARNQFVLEEGKIPWIEKISAVKSDSGCGAKSQTAGLFSGLAPFLAGLGGRFAGEGENVMATVGPNNAPLASIQACSGKVSASVLGIGRLFAAPLYRTKTGRTKNPAAAVFVAWVKTTYTGSAWQNLTGDAKYMGTGPQYLVPADDALCGIAGIGGKFNGYGEKVELTQEAVNGQRVWRALANRGPQASEPYVGFTVRCLARDQRPL
ncbi:hypothetical protein P6144_09350 [Sphingomonas sp. HITSZ_GF]|uniref:hypothetical protein n=1 Tax=Sphingomonas sp. HITSZ_GF TaxID=3037247 RepID=UPI00240DE5BA|nr:hypothetical protein [Sphingomonas sp. HITSZ_GF]MDG2533849.1 hypothetical protein [Sphingomonas sp. HITSZ_GF]